MITILLEKIITILEGWILSFASHAQHVEDKLDSLDQTASDIKTNTDPISDIKDNTGAVITPIQNIKSNTDSIATSSQTSANNTTAILNNVSTLSTNTGRAAAFAEDCANNTLEIKDKITTIASDTTQLRADSAELNDMSDKIYEAIKWTLADKYINETESGPSPMSFDTDIADDLISCNVGLVAQQLGSGDPAPDNVRAISGYSTMSISFNGSSFSFTLGNTYYGGYLDIVSGKLVIDHEYKDLGDFNWNSSTNGYSQNTSDLNMKPTASGNVVAAILCSALKPDTPSNVYNRVTDNTVSTGLNPRLRVYMSTLAGTTAAQFKAGVTGIKISYELANPVEITLTPQQLTAIAGVNTITSDTNGNIEVTYKESIKHYLDKQDN